MSEILFAAERLLPAAGGAERFVLEALAHLAGRGHRVRALWIAGEPAAGAIDLLPAGVEGRAVPAPRAAPYWEQRRLRRELLGRAVAEALDERAANTVITQLHGAPAVIAAAGAARTLLVLPSYESFCKLAFDWGSPCRPDLGCGTCPGSAALDAAERSELVGSRAAHAAALAAASTLIAPSEHIAEVCESWCGRRPQVVRPVTQGAAAAAEPAFDGPLMLAAATWRPNKGSNLIVPLVAALGGRRFRITRPGLEPDQLRALDETGRVELVDPAPIAELLAGASVALVPSQWPEPFGRVAFEAASAGLPVLASAVGGLVEIVPASELVRAPADVGAWSDAVRRLSDAVAWESARLRARESARDLLSDQPVLGLEALAAG